MWGSMQETLPPRVRRTQPSSSSFSPPTALLDPTPEQPAEPRLPREALARLTAGNQRFLDRTFGHPPVGVVHEEERTWSRAPYASVLGYAGSRVAPETLFNETVGALYTVRASGLTAGRYEIASIEYAAADLGSRVTVVLGHPMPGTDDGRCQAAAEHVLRQVDALQRSSRTIGRLVRSGAHAVVGAVYGRRTGRVRFLI